MPASTRSVNEPSYRYRYHFTIFRFILAARIIYYSNITIVRAIIMFRDDPTEADVIARLARPTKQGCSPYSMVEFALSSLYTNILSISNDQRKRAH